MKELQQLMLELQVLCRQQTFSVRPQRKPPTFRSQCHAVKFLLLKTDLADNNTFARDFMIALTLFFLPKTPTV